SPAFYVTNAVAEFHRYDMDLFSNGGLHGTRAGAWIPLLALLPALCSLAVRFLRDRARIETPIFTAVVALAVHGLGFAFLLKSKSRFYVSDIWCIAVLVLAYVAVELWDEQRAVLTRAALVLAVGLVTIEGSVRLLERAELAATVTPYADYEARLAAIV